MRRNSHWTFDDFVAHAAGLAPDDSVAQLALGRRFAQRPPEDLAQRDDLLRIAVAGDLDSQFFCHSLSAQLLACGLPHHIHDAGYDSMHRALLDADSSLYMHSPDLVILLPDSRCFNDWPAMLATDAEVEQWVANHAAQRSNLRRCLSARLPRCRLLEANLVPPRERALGNLEANLPYSRRALVMALNQRLREERPDGVLFIDLEHLASELGYAQWFDDRSLHLYRTPFAQQLLPVVVGRFMPAIQGARGAVRKCLVLDLDNTLWGGVLADEGIHGIATQPGDPLGEAFLAFQRYVLRLAARGVILAVCSKNDLSLVEAAFRENDDLLIRESDIACMVANWEDKASNLRAIAAGLRIGVDSLVFVDDNPVERELVRRVLPEVLTVEMPADPADYVAALDAAAPFDWIQLTAEDIARQSSYHADRERMKLLRNTVDYDEYLLSLKMSVEIYSPRPHDLGRFAQLINRSNQFNLRTRRYSDSDIAAMQADPMCGAGRAPLRSLRRLRHRRRPHSAPRAPLPLHRQLGHELPRAAAAHRDGDLRRHPSLRPGTGLRHHRRLPHPVRAQRPRLEPLPLAGLPRPAGLAAPRPAAALADG